ncbi:hypothetical protein KAR91_37120 [Candidatus Pacearchaeota archaeon]|nr:hypothetical protein [Candidatus Pacearchaeota archaeon]
MITHILQEWLLDNKPVDKKFVDWKDDFAKQVGVSRSFLDMVMKGRRDFSWPHSVNRIILATGGAITTKDIRPDIVKAIIASDSLFDEVVEGRRAENKECSKKETV